MRLVWLAWLTSPLTTLTTLTTLSTFSARSSLTTHCANGLPRRLNASRVVGDATHGTVRDTVRKTVGRYGRAGRTPWQTQPRRLVLVAAWASCAALGQPALAQSDTPGAITDASFSFLRYDENFGFLADPALRTTPYTDIKYIPLGDEADQFLTFGGDLRERVDSYRYPMFGRTGVAQDTTHLHRLLLHANLEWDRVRVFVELGNETENGRLPAATPTDTDRLDLAQAFIDWRTRLAGGDLTLRLGREELLFGEGLLIGPRDVPNIREDWDGARAIWTAGDTRIDLLAVRPVNNLPGIFDDQTSTEQALWGAYGVFHPTLTAPFAVDLYALGTENTALVVADGKGADHRATFGGRTYGHVGPVDATLELIGQTGTFDDRTALAYAFHSEAGYTWRELWASPRLGFRFDDLSGNRNRGSGTEGSFYPISPNLSYSTEASIEAATNLRQTGIVLGLTPLPEVTVSAEFEGLWRDSTADAFYVAPNIPLFEPHGANQRFTGTESELYGSWRVNPFFLLKTALVHFNPGAFVTSAGGHAINYAMLTAALRF